MVSNCRVYARVLVGFCCRIACWGITAVFGANRGPRPSVDGLVSVGNGGPSTDGLAFPNK